MENKKLQQIVETEAYLDDLSKVIYKGQDEIELRKGIREEIFKNPLIGKVIPRTGGVRKFRYAAPGRGKSGGYRIIYYFYDEHNPVFLLKMYTKSFTENLTSKEENFLFTCAKHLKKTFKA